MCRLATLRMSLVCVGLLALAMGQGCPVVDDGDNGDNGEPPVYHNTTDRTNSGATYLGSAACRSCHIDVAPSHELHGHAHALNRVLGRAPQIPQGGVPDPPEGFAWSEIAYVIGGYTHKARFVNQDGSILVTGAEGASGNGVTGVDAQWNLAFEANGTSSGFVPYEPDRETALPYDYDCFVCHTTGAEPQDEDAERFQENRPGIGGTWQEEGVQCERCHGPGSNHVPNPQTRDLFVDLGDVTCKECHTDPLGSDGSEIRAEGGFILSRQQYAELRASGVHAAFKCTTCHNPHAGTRYDRDNAIWKDCTECHAGQSMALHEGKVFVRGDYSEALDCTSCHMPFATKSASSAGPEVAGDTGRIGDVRTHIFRINAESDDYTAMFTEDLGAVVKDERGAAAVTLDFVCLRCHNGIGNAFALTLPVASLIGEDIHESGE